MSRRGELAEIACVLCAACSSAEPEGFAIDSEPARQTAQPLAIVRGHADRTSELRVSWQNVSAGTRGTPVLVQVQETPCLVVVPCTPENDRSTTMFAAAIPLAPGANALELVGDAPSRHWERRFDVQFVPGDAPPSVHVDSAQTPFALSDGAETVVTGGGNGLVALGWRNESTGASGTISGTNSGFGFTMWDVGDLSEWSVPVRLSAGVNRITVHGRAWNDSDVDASIDVSWTP